MLNIDDLLEGIKAEEEEIFAQVVYTYINYENLTTKESKEQYGHLILNMLEDIFKGKTQTQIESKVRSSSLFN